ncbi:MAG: hypothetical protein DRO12_05695 [Thermoprotei archaeon]|nr:MAG: hypothetical protein DRO12_05695 [Thermoprotei archaeon]
MVCDLVKNLVEAVKNLDTQRIIGLLERYTSKKLSTLTIESEESVVTKFISDGKIIGDHRRTARVSELGLVVEPGSELSSGLGLDRYKEQRRPLYLIVSYAFPIDKVQLRVRWGGVPKPFFVALVDEQTEILVSASDDLEQRVSDNLRKCLEG